MYKSLIDILKNLVAKAFISNDNYFSNVFFFVFIKLTFVKWQIQ